MAVLEKLRPLNEKEKSFKICNSQDEAESTETINENNKRDFDEKLPQNQRKRRRKDGYREDPFVFFDENEPVWPDIKDFYKISDDFDVKCLLVRCHVGKKKNIYYTSPAMRDLVLKNQGTIKFINTGIKAFVRSDNRNMKCAFR